MRTLLLLLVCTSLIASELRGEPVSEPREWLAVALSPLVWVADIPTRLGQLTDHLRSRRQLIEENKQLERRQLQIESQLHRYAALDAENRRLRGLLEASARLQDRVVAADIIASNQDPYRQQITLDKGERHGVYRGQALVDAVSKRDFPIVQACCLIFAATFILLNLAADVGAILTNPRLRHPK